MSKNDNQWVNHTTFFENESNKECCIINVDTRDFHIHGIKEKLLIKHDIILSMANLNRERFIFSFEDIKNLINRLFEESGGENEWRHFCFKDNLQLPCTDDWRFKYIRFYWWKENQWLLSDDKNRFYRKSVIMDAKVKIQPYDK